MDLKKCSLGIELGSTRIKAVLLNEVHTPVATGCFEWENQLEKGIWTYPTDLIHKGLQECYADLRQDFERRTGRKLTTVGAMGVSGMMHGYFPFDKDFNQLAVFRTWRNTITGPAAEKLTERFEFNIPQRWSIAHLYQAILNGEDHIPKLAHLTTLAGYVHLLLTGENVLGVGEGSGMFPIDSSKLDYDEKMMSLFDTMPYVNRYSWRLRDVLPKLLPAGSPAGILTAAGAKFLDPTGTLQPGIPLCPPEGDAGTGMTATNSVSAHTGNVSAGTSIFAMVVVDHMLGVHKEIDMVTTPTGIPVAMIHCNNCTSDINTWVELFSQFDKARGGNGNKQEIFSLLFEEALKGDATCGGLLSYNYFSGESITDIDEGRPLFVRTPDAKMCLANFMRCHLQSALATLKIGMDILTEEEHICVKRIYGHGGFFKTRGVGQKILSAAIKAPVSVMETAGEGGPYGMALLAAYMLGKKGGEKLEEYLREKVFASSKHFTVFAEQQDMDGFDAYLSYYRAALPTERVAVKTFQEK